MQGQDTQKSNVVSLFDTRNKNAAKNDEVATTDDKEACESFVDVIKQNEKNRERLAKERANANKSVLRSYRIKH